MQNVKVVCVQQIVNLTLWSEYGCINRRVKDAHGQLQRKGIRTSTSLQPAVSTWIKSAFSWIELDESLGEELLLHGTTHLEAIKEHGSSVNSRSKLFHPIIPEVPLTGNPLDMGGAWDMWDV